MRTPPCVADLEAICQRVSEQLNRKLSDLSSPYLRGKRKVTVGYAVVFHNPLIMAERVVARLVGEAWETVRIQRMQADFQTRCRLQDVLLGHQITTVFQPIVDLQTGAVHGFEALSRGPAGTQQHSPMNLFEAAKASELTFEVDQHCRRGALRTARDLPPPHRLFINVVPAAMYDPDFQVGRNHVSSNIIIGLGETDACVRQGVEYLAQMGVIPVLRPISISPLRRDELKTAARPGPGRVLDLTRMTREILRKYGLSAAESKTMCLACTGCDLTP